MSMTTAAGGACRESLDSRFTNAATKFAGSRLRAARNASSAVLRQCDPNSQRAIGARTSSLGTAPSAGRTAHGVSGAARPGLGSRTDACRTTGSPCVVALSPVSRRAGARDSQRCEGAYRLYSFMSVKSAFSARSPTVPPAQTRGLSETSGRRKAELRTVIHRRADPVHDQDGPRQMRNDAAVQDVEHP